MGLVYAVPIASSAQTGAIDWVEVRAAASRCLRLVELRIGQSTEVGDTQEEMIRWAIKLGTGTVTSGSGGSSPTITCVTGTGSAGFTAEVNNTTQLAVGTGTLVTVAQDPFNVRTGLLYVPLPEARWMMANQNYIAIGMAAAPADSITWEGCAYFEED
jgi:hypothetical protein